MMPNQAWLEFIEASGDTDNPRDRCFFLAGFQAGLNFAEYGLYKGDKQAFDEILRTVHALKDMEYGRANKT